MPARIAILILALFTATPLNATERNDGHESNSSGSGTCSHHGGELR